MDQKMEIFKNLIAVGKIGIFNFFTVLYFVRIWRYWKNYSEMLVFVSISNGYILHS